MGWDMTVSTKKERNIFWLSFHGGSEDLIWLHLGYWLHSLQNKNDIRISYQFFASMTFLAAFFHFQIFNFKIFWICLLLVCLQTRAWYSLDNCKYGQTFSINAKNRCITKDFFRVTLCATSNKHLSFEIDYFCIFFGPSFDFKVLSSSVLKNHNGIW